MQKSNHTPSIDPDNVNLIILNLEISFALSAVSRHKCFTESGYDGSTYYYVCKKKEIDSVKFKNISLEYYCLDTKCQHRDLLLEDIDSKYGINLRYKDSYRKSSVSLP